MTTILIDRKNRIMAADRQTTCSDGSRVLSTKIKKTEYDGTEVLIACCGDAEAKVAFALWFEEQEKARKGMQVEGAHKDVHYPQKADFQAVVLFSTGDVQWYGPSGYPIPIIERYFGIGSGSGYGLGALHSGTDIRTAVQIACRLDSGSGMGIQVMEFSGKKKRKRKHG